MNEKNAVIISSGEQHEARCANCGKLLLTFKLSNTVDNSSQNVIIVSRCTRSDCKTDNIILITT